MSRTRCRGVRDRRVAARKKGAFLTFPEAPSEDAFYRVFPARIRIIDKEKTIIDRRRFLTDGARALCGVGLLGAGIGLHSRKALPAQALRPPGALPEEDFLAACVRCGLCVRACPYDIVRLAEPGEPISTGTPYFISRTGPCEMCPDIPCVPVCPSGALDHGLTEIDKARMGLAVLADQESCIAFRGLRCEVCFNTCPVRGKAITIEPRANPRTGMHAMLIPVVHSEHCTGCGKCEQACILEEAAIKVYPRQLARGAAGEHYRLGWEERNKMGEALVTPDAPHRYHLPKGMDYEHAGRGLIRETPFSSNPLDTLNKGDGRP
uniref:Ferredoxin-type protein NapG n=1 Tax=Candidatus Kentrum sp. TC TaxID=2126339 RepID=A0A450Z8G4_9GAMM|nr:MAG: ferredoxin-type protein NapG [Candidatus Kentron sp. TC]